MARKLAARARAFLTETEKREPMTEAEAREVFGGHYEATFQKLYSEGMVKRNRRGRGGDIILTDEGREALATAG
jgi:Mn-dependent DtxR family transcriptional regulator